MIVFSFYGRTSRFQHLLSVSGVACGSHSEFLQRWRMPLRAGILWNLKLLPFLSCCFALNCGGPVVTDPQTLCCQHVPPHAKTAASSVFADLDVCHPNPCANGATCVESADSFRCLCLPSYGGERCDVGTSSVSANTNTRFGFWIKQVHDSFSWAGGSHHSNYKTGFGCWPLKNSSLRFALRLEDLQMISSRKWDEIAIFNVKHGFQMIEASLTVMIGMAGDTRWSEAALWRHP